MCLIEDQSWIDCIDITSRWDTFVLFHLYGNKGVSLPLWPIRPRWFHTFSPCAEPLGDGHEGMGARFGSQGSIALNYHSRYSGTRYSGTWLYIVIGWGNSFLTNRWQAISWTNADPDLPHMASLDSILYNKPTNSWKHRSVYTILWNIWHQFLNLLLAKIRTQGHMVKLRTFPGDKDHVQTM